MNNNDIVATQKTTIDHEALKVIVDVINKSIIELTAAKKKADMAWANCESMLDKNILKSIETKKNENSKKFTEAINELENNAKVLSSISNLWKDAEDDISNTSKELDELINKINTSLSQLFGLRVFNIKNDQNDSSNI